MVVKLEMQLLNVAYTNLSSNYKLQFVLFNLLFSFASR